MNKEKEAKRKAQLAKKTLDESFRFQVWWGRNQKARDVSDDNPLVNAELDTVCNLGLTKDILTLRDIILNAEKELGIVPIADKGTLNGSPVAYLLGISQINPMADECVGLTLADIKEKDLPLQIEVFYDNDVRNKVVELVKGQYEGVTTRLGQPVLKQNKSVIYFKRVITQ